MMARDATVRSDVWMGSVLSVTTFDSKSDEFPLIRLMSAYFALAERRI